MINWYVSLTEFTGRTGALHAGTGRTDALRLSQQEKSQPE